MCDNEKEARMFVDLVITAHCEGLSSEEQEAKARALKDKFFPNDYQGWRFMRDEDNQKP